MHSAPSKRRQRWDITRTGGSYEGTAGASSKGGDRDD